MDSLHRTLLEMESLHRTLGTLQMTEPRSHSAEWKFRRYSARDESGDTALTKVLPKPAFRLQSYNEIIGPLERFMLCANAMCTAREWKDGATVFHRAAVTRNYALIQFLLRNTEPDFHELQHIQDFSGNTPLMIAVRNNDVITTEFLVRHYNETSYLQHTNREGKSALDLASNPTIKQLLSKALAPTIKTPKGTEIPSGSNLTLEIFQDLAREDTAGFRVTCERSTKETIDRLFKPNRSGEDSTILHWILENEVPGLYLKAMWVLNAARRHNAEILNQQNTKGQTALHIAAELGQLNLVELLLSRGPDLYQLDNEGSTVLHYAVRSHCQCVTQLLLDYHMHQSCKGGNVDFIDKQDIHGRTALHCAIAVMDGHEHPNHLLYVLTEPWLRTRAPNLKDGMGQIPIDILLEQIDKYSPNCHEECVPILYRRTSKWSLLQALKRANACGNSDYEEKSEDD